MKFLLHTFVFSTLVLFSNVLYSQTVSGTVVDASTGEPLAYVKIKNLTTNKGELCDLNGAFQIEASLNKDSLRIGFTGYEPKVVLAQSTISVQLNSLTLSMDEVVVSADREYQNRTDAPVAISSIDTKTIEDNKPTTIDQVLNQVAGVNMVSLGNEQHTMSIRRPIDYGASYLYLEDGVPIRSSGVFNHNALLEINMTDVGRIEIIRGPASSIYGSEAIGGAVNFITKRPSLMPSAGIRVQGNNIGYRRADAYASTTINKKIGLRVSSYYANQRNGTLDYSDFDKFALSLSANYSFGKRTNLIWSNAFVDYDSDMRGSLDSANFYNQSFSSNQNFTYRKVKAWRSKLSLTHRWTERAKTMLIAYYRNNSIEQNPSYRIRDDYKPWIGIGDPNLAHGQVNENSFNSLGTIAQHRQNFEFCKSSLITGISADFSPNDYYANYIRVYKNDEGVYESYQNTDSILADYRADISNLATYMRYSIEPFNHLKLVAGLRYDFFDYHFDNHLDSNAFTAVLDGKNTFSRITPKLGAIFDWMPGRGAYMNYSQGFVPPQVTTLYVGNKVPSLKPVYFNNYEVGTWFTLAKNRLKLELNIYRMDGENDIISVLRDDGSTEQVNAGETRHRGVELSVKALVINDLSIRLSSTYARHEFIDYRDGSTDLSGNRMPQAPDWLANAQITYRPSYINGLRISLEWQYVGEYFMESTNMKVFQAYNLFNLRAAYKWRGIEFWCNWLNLSDELYATVARANAWGQRYSMGNPMNVNLGLSFDFMKKTKK